MATCENVAQVVTALDGVPAVARMTGCGDTAVYNWIARDRLPPRFYKRMIAKLERRGHTAHHALWGQEELVA